MWKTRKKERKKRQKINTDGPTEVKGEENIHTIDFPPSKTPEPNLGPTQAPTQWVLVVSSSRSARASISPLTSICSRG